jgi:hypothetical protein
MRAAIFVLSCILIGSIALCPASGCKRSAGVKNIPPKVIITTPEHTCSGDVIILYNLSDRENDTVGIVVEFSIDNGQTYSNAVQGNGGDPTTELSTSSIGGIDYTYVWDSIACNVAMTEVKNFVRIRIHPYDQNSPGQAVESGNFTVNNTGVNVPPAALVATPSDGQNGDIIIAFTLLDNQSDLLSISALYSTDNGLNYNSATEGQRGDGTVGLSSSPTGIGYIFIWDTLSDGIGIDNAESVIFKIIPRDLECGSDATSGEFIVNNAGIAATSVFVDASNLSGIENGTFSFPYQHIQDAIDASGNGGRIFVAAGSYIENLVVDKNIFLYGKGPDKTNVFALDNSMAVIVLGSPGNNISGEVSGITFKRGGNGIEAVSFAGTIKNCVSMGNLGAGITINGGSPVIVNNVFSYNLCVGVDISGGDIILKNNIITENYYCIDDDC